MKPPKPVPEIRYRINKASRKLYGRKSAILKAQVIPFETPGATRHVSGQVLVYHFPVPYERNDRGYVDTMRKVDFYALYDYANLADAEAGLVEFWKARIKDRREKVARAKKFCAEECRHWIKAIHRCKALLAKETAPAKKH